MKKIMNKVIAAVLCALMILSVLPITAFAAVNPGSPYVYTYGGISQRSPHVYARTNLNNPSDRHYNPPSLYYVTKGSDKFYVYCSDYHTDIQDYPVYYKRIAIEDACYKDGEAEDGVHYYSEEEAKKLRAIFKNGYKNTLTDDDLAALATAAGIDNTTNPLTRGEALYATQIAIWQYGNSNKVGDPIGNAEEGLTTPPYYFGTVFGLPSNPFSKTTEKFDDKGYSAPSQIYYYSTSCEYYYNNNVLDNITKVFNYLMGLEGVELTKDEIVFSDDYFVDWSLASVTENGTKYDLTIYFGLEKPLTNEDDVTLTVKDSQGATLKTQSIKANERDNYSVTVTVESAEPSTLTFELSGTQNVPDSIYLYRSDEDGQGGYEGQNFIGTGSGSTPVKATMDVEYEIETDVVKLTKVNLDGSLKLTECVFDLYGEYTPEGYDEPVTILMKEGCRTNEDGEILIENLPDGLTYYFKETAANEKYMVVDPDRKYYVDEEGKIEVANVLKEGDIKITNKVENTVDEDYKDHEFDYTITLDMSTSEYNILKERLKKQDEQQQPKTDAKYVSDDEGGSIGKKNAVIEVPEGTYVTELWQDGEKIGEGTIQLDESTNYTGTFKLKDGQELVIKKIPAKAGYVVSQAVRNPYKLTIPGNENGSIPSDAAVQVDYLNVYKRGGSDNPIIVNPPEDNPDTGAPVILPSVASVVSGVYVNAIVNKK